jgi:hypothetical protein
MSSIETLVNILSNFTSEQLERFLEDPLTRSILQPEAEAEPSPLAAS